MTEIKSPMPGTIIEILAKIGGEVLEGEVLMVIESMKMENPITAPHAGRVADIGVTSNTVVDKGHLLMILE